MWLYKSSTSIFIFQKGKKDHYSKYPRIIQNQNTFKALFLTTRNITIYNKRYRQYLQIYWARWVFWQKQSPEVFSEISQNSQENTSARDFLNEVADLRPVTLFKKCLWHRCFPVNFGKFLRIPFLQKTSGQLFLFWSSFQAGCSQ